MTESRWHAPWVQVIRTALASTVRTPGAARRHELRWTGDHLGDRIVGPDGRTYIVFRDTGRVPPHEPVDIQSEPAVVVAGFRFAWLGRAGSWRHRLFLRVCIVTVPLFSGLAGYRRKLWLAEDGGDRYLGIYEWAGASAADEYVWALLPILRLLAVKGSVFGHVIADRTVDEHLAPVDTNEGPLVAAE